MDWLLDSDPAIAWQAMQDLKDASPAAVAAMRARVPHEGVGAEILALQEPDGSWRRADSPVWLPTLFTFLFLRATGVDPADPAVVAAVSRIESSMRWDNRGGRWELRQVESGANPFFEGETEPCINGGGLALGGYFGRPNAKLASRLLSEQLADGGWNCDAPKSKVSSYHTTICVLEGLLEYERAVGSAPEITAARRRGEEYLLKRDLFRRLSTGEPANPELPALGPIRAWPKRFASSKAGVSRMAVGCSIRRGLNRSHFRSTNRWGSRAAGTRSAPCACFAGTRSRVNSRRRPARFKATC